MAALPVFLLLCLAATGLCEPLHKRIIHGYDVQPDLHPYIVSIYTRRNLNDGTFDKAHNCSGVLLTKTWVLTAAHCLNNIGFKYFGYARVKINGQSLKLNGYYSHTKYDQMDPFHGDLGLIRLDLPVTLNNKVRIASLADKGTIFSDAGCVLAGWGGNYPDRLQEAKFRTISMAECAKYHKGITEKHICVQDANTPAASSPRACFRDGGSPLMCSNVLVGVASYVQDVCGSDVPLVYTRVSEYRPFIDNLINRFK